MTGSAMALLLGARAVVSVQVSEPMLMMWEHHRGLIVGFFAAVMLVKLALIIRLLIERRQRRQAQLVAEQQLSYLAHMARVATVGELAATLAHELRQPLAAIRYNAETASRMIARADSSRAELKEVVDAVAADNARASDVVDRVATLLRREDRPPEPVDLNEVCQGVRRLLQSTAATHRASVELALDPVLPTIMGDTVQLQQVVMNLVLNALEAFSQGDGPRIVVVTTTNRGAAVELLVRDSGPGVPNDITERLFEPFFSTKPQGLGMGLVIVRSIVERHGGKIEAQTHASGGAVFRVVLPLANGQRVVSTAGSHAVGRS